MMSFYGKLWTGVITVLLIFSFSSAEAKPRDSLVFVSASVINTLDPYKGTLRPTIIWGRHVYDPLLERDVKTMRPKPHLAESWKRLNDVTLEFRLKKGVKFHNGDPFNAECVKFTIERVLNPDFKSPIRTNYDWIDKVEAVDDYTVRIKSKYPYPLALERLTLLFVYSPKYVKGKEDGYIGEHPMGTGPYKLKAWKRGQEIEFEANPEYWGPVPKIKNLRVRMIAEDSIRYAELLSGGVDVIETVSPDEIGMLKSNPKFKVETAEVLRLYCLDMDGSGVTGPSPFTDIRVRRAVAHAIDVEGIKKNVLKGYAGPTATGVNPLQFGYNPDVRKYEFNPQKAKQLLKEAGYPNGFKTTLYATIYKEVVEAIMGNLKEVGIEVELKWYGGYFSEAAKLFIAKKAGPLWQHTWGSYGVFDAQAALYNMFYSKQQVKWGYNQDPQLDRWLEEVSSTTENEKREKTLKKIQEFIMEQAYWVPLHTLYLSQGLNKKLHYKPDQDEMYRIFDAYWEE